MTNAQFALRVSLIARIASQFTHELVYGMWNPDFCTAEAAGRDRFLEAIESHLAQIRDGMPTLADRGMNVENTK